ncbi:hypothetical protein H8M03_12325 [Sphingomonas sabuli]|uniref:Uncharacterized protein n=1 Tax=Sphingomonas sabuli TaxID=2764186 RepID=A0A7G9L2A4_9SPHN|nr:hypothetical protein [Sphingomonas sabuli]QNM82753.1 hypothetical protein H8M03_12325 [Sphingomonas sabuli]
MRNRGIGRGRMFVGGFLLLGTVIAWATGFLTDPHAINEADGSGYVRSAVITYVRNVALVTIFLSAVSAWLLFPARRPYAPKRDLAIIALILLLIGSSLWQLYWLRSMV